MALKGVNGSETSGRSLSAHRLRSSSSLFIVNRDVQFRKAVCHVCHRLLQLGSDVHIPCERLTCLLEILLLPSMFSIRVCL